MTARTAELTGDQLDAIGAFATWPQLSNLVADPDAPFDGMLSGTQHEDGFGRKLVLEWRGPGITGTVDSRDVQVSTAQIRAWARALPGPAERAKLQHAVVLFTQTRCASPADFVPPPMSGPQSARTLHVCAVPAIYHDEQVRQLISHAGVPEYGFDFPYPCRWCERVGFHESMADRPEVDALAERLRGLGVLVSDERRDVDADKFPAELVGHPATSSPSLPTRWHETRSKYD